MTLIVFSGRFRPKIKRFRHFTIVFVDKREDKGYIDGMCGDYNFYDNVFFIFKSTSGIKRYCLDYLKYWKGGIK